MAGYSWLNRQNSNNKDYKVYVELRNAHSNRAVKLRISSLAHGFFSVYCVVLCTNAYS